MGIETQLREKIRAIYQEAERQAKPYWDELTRLDSLKPRTPFIIPGWHDRAAAAQATLDAQARNLEIHKRRLGLREPGETSTRHWPTPPPETSELPQTSPPPGASATDTAD